ncbi:MAG: GTP cyclohydrolase FolE2 [Spirochaetaceae bacterium]
MVDVQGQKDERNIPLQKVGVKNLRHPVTVLDKHHGTQPTIATADIFVSLPHHYKGTHMSRFIEVFSNHYSDIQMPTFLDMLEEVREALEAESAFADVSFPYFLQKAAPVTGQKSLMSYGCTFMGEVGNRGRRFYVQVEVPVQTVCPCSREISSRGAHNQRGTVRVTVKLGPFFWMEDIIAIVEDSASSGLYTLLKREDERYITETAYDNPVFVEDLVREICTRVEDLHLFPWFSVEAENAESIHNHEAYAYVERTTNGLPHE